MLKPLMLDRVAVPDTTEVALMLEAFSVVVETVFAPRDEVKN